METESVLASLKDTGYKIQETGITDVFITVDEESSFNLSRSQAYLDKQIYIQELSSLLPPLLLDPKENENILDLCASPGSKTLFLNHLAKRKANIYANEIDKKRFFNMKKNFEAYGANNIQLLNQDGTKLSSVNPEFIEYFDKIMVDVPCSSENTLNFEDQSSFQFWNYKKYRSFVKVQKKLLFEAYTMLKPGGTLVYSTCTYSIEENEAIINSLLQEYGENIEVQYIINAINDFKCFKTMNGFIQSNKSEFDERITKSVRILPNENARSFFYLQDY